MKMRSKLYLYITYHSAPAVPGIVPPRDIHYLDDVILVVVVSDVGLVQHTIIVLPHLDNV